MTATAAAAAVDRTLAALADPTRRAVIDLLRRKPRRAGELAETLGISPPALSRHLRVLRKSGVIIDDDVEDDARVRLYRLQPEPFSVLRGWLDDVETFWAGQLAAFKVLAELKARKRR
jgi:DNA-binding transcriptional ArsR family regulator